MEGNIKRLKEYQQKNEAKQEQGKKESLIFSEKTKEEVVSKNATAFNSFKLNMSAKKIAGVPIKKADKIHTLIEPQ